MPADRILECPFCLSSRVRVNSTFVTCSDCFADGPMVFRDSQEEQEDLAIELWNRRTGTVYNGKTAEEWYRMYMYEVRTQ